MPAPLAVPVVVNEQIVDRKTVLEQASPSVLQSEQKRQHLQNTSLMNEVERDIHRQMQIMREVAKDVQALESKREVIYSLPSRAVAGAEFYHSAFNKIILDTVFSIKENNFLVENAFFGNKMDKAEFDKVIKQSADFLIAKMKELNYSLTDNSAKNFMLFQFFSETLQLKSSKQEHLPFKYDFEDYMGFESHSKLFVSKLMETGSGQCHSLPMLYLILAEEIGAEAYLALSPNHSYIRFPDQKGKWYNVELTNGMFSTESYILQSGYIKSEALQNKIYMQNLSRKELLAQHLTDLAGGYIFKFGYDEFVQAVIDKALALYPNSITANMLKANIASARFEYVMKQLGINPKDPNDLQNIRHFPKAIELLDSVNQQFDLVDNLGYEHMPEYAYQKWLQAMAGEKQKQDNENISKQLKGILAKPPKTLKD
ncbi:hypothetical protein [Flavobacterium soli]|uniref:hypothetical protein n=1 Tax=Flavobacterium soli TaxID=344881 RepID=UPI0012FA3E69|nr:hypothetical protein [Flavobacterium soli]